MKAGHEQGLAWWRTDALIVVVFMADQVLCLQASGHGQEASLVVFDQINAEASDELKVGFRKCGHP